MRKIELAIFDMDGLMIDSESVYIRNACDTLTQMGYEPDIDMMIETIGIDWTITEKLYSERYPDMNYREFEKNLFQTESEYLKLHPFEVKKGLIELLNYLKKEKILTAVATSTHQPVAGQRLNDTGLTSYFDEIITGDLISEGKPSPQIYLTALDKFNVSSENAIVFEDSKNGLLSADNAGIRCVIVPDICVIPEDILKKAYKVVPDLSYGIDIINELNEKC